MSKILKNAAKTYSKELSNLLDSISQEGKQSIAHGIFPINQTLSATTFASIVVGQALATNAKIDNSMQEILPELGARQVKDVTSLAKELIKLVPELIKFLSEKENLLEDRVLAASAVGYLIMPFDIIPDELGLAGTVDDALIAFRLAENLKEPSNEIASLVADNNNLVEQVEKSLPEWLGDAINSSIKLAIQERAIFSAYKMNGAQ